MALKAVICVALKAVVPVGVDSRYLADRDDRQPPTIQTTAAGTAATQPLGLCTARD